MAVWLFVMDGLPCHALNGDSIASGRELLEVVDVDLSHGHVFDAVCIVQYYIVFT